MEIFTLEAIWLLLAYSVGTAFGIYWCAASNFRHTQKIVDVTVDMLIRDGYILTRTDDNGEVHLLKVNERG